MIENLPQKGTIVLPCVIVFKQSPAMAVEDETEIQCIFKLGDKTCVICEAAGEEASIFLKAVAAVAHPKAIREDKEGTKFSKRGKSKLVIVK